MKGYFGFFAWTLLAVFAIMTLNCTMIYHGSTFSEKYFGEEEAQEQTTQERTEELLRIYNDIVSHCNALEYGGWSGTTAAQWYIPEVWTAR